MSKKIVLFLSILKEEAKTEKAYNAPDGKIYTGRQTNQAPVKYLLKNYEDISEIICIVTPEARNTAWIDFCDEVHAVRTDVEIIDVPFEKENRFEKDVLPSILAKFNQTGEDGKNTSELLLETTGGFRDAIMYLLLISRILSYKGVKTVNAVYSDGTVIKDVSNLICLFDLVGGMQELTSFGSAKTLRKYYAGKETDEKIDKMLVALENLNEAIVLCRTKDIKPCMDKFSLALDEVSTCEDVLMRELIPAFKQKFGKKLNTPGLIKWCLESDMLQQALTVYTENIPGYLISERNKEYLIVSKEEIDRISKLKGKNYLKSDTTLFYEGFLLLSAEKPNEGGDIANGFKKFVAEHRDALANSYGIPKVPEKYRAGIDNIASIVCTCYEKGNPRFITKEAIRKMVEDRYKTKPFPKSAVGFVNDVDKFSLDQIFILLEMKQNLPIDASNKKSCSTDRRIATIENLAELLPRSAYTVNIPIKWMQDIARDYLYIKALRNQTNHAGPEANEEQKALMDYLSKFGYIAPEKASQRNIDQAIRNALDRIKNATAKKQIKQ